MKEYLLVLEYADEGTLRNYLEKKFSTLNWEDKYRLAFQLSSAIECLHESGIVHNDLHSSNIFIQQNSIKLANFGQSKLIKPISVNTIPYIDPQGVNTTGDVQMGNVYSVGVLMWELSSGKVPFADKENSLSLAVEIAQGLREEIIEGTPERYSNLYASK